MTYFFVLIVLSSAVATRQFICCAALALISVMLAVRNVGNSEFWHIAMQLYLLLICLPLCACIIGHISASMFEIPAAKKLLSFASATIGFFILFNSNYFELAISQILVSGSVNQNWTGFLMLLNKICFAAGLVSAVLVLLVIATELPANWLLRKNIELVKYTKLARPLIVLICCSFLFERMLELIGATLFNL